MRVNEQTENIGARRLHTVLERVLEDVSFDAPESTGRVEIDGAYVRGRLADVVANADLSGTFSKEIHIRSGRVRTRRRGCFTLMKKPIGALFALVAAAGALAACNGSNNNLVRPGNRSRTAVVRQINSRCSFRYRGREKPRLLWQTFTSRPKDSCRRATASISS